MSELAKGQRHSRILKMTDSGQRRWEEGPKEQRGRGSQWGIDHAGAGVAGGGASQWGGAWDITNLSSAHGGLRGRMVGGLSPCSFPRCPRSSAPSMMRSSCWQRVWRERGQPQGGAGCQEQPWLVMSRMHRSPASVGPWEELRSPRLCCWTRMLQVTGCWPPTCWTPGGEPCYRLGPRCTSLTGAQDLDLTPGAGSIQMSSVMEVRANTQSPQEQSPWTGNQMAEDSQLPARHSSSGTLEVLLHPLVCTGTPSCQPQSPLGYLLAWRHAYSFEEPPNYDLASSCASDLEPPGLGVL